MAPGPAPSVLVIDNFDSFTFTLVDYLRRLGAHVRVERNDALTVDEAMSAGWPILISPGPGVPEAAGISVSLAKACIAAKRPLAGICLGHQAIAVAAGGTVNRVFPMHGKAVEVSHDGTGLFAGIPSLIAATRYHSLAVSALAATLRANAWSHDGVIMGICHESAPVHGLQFHPESVATEHGLGMLANFLRIAGSTTA